MLQVSLKKGRMHGKKGGSFSGFDKDQRSLGDDQKII
jgi:hypothetical protein